MGTWETERGKSLAALAVQEMALRLGENQGGGASTLHERAVEGADAVRKHGEPDEVIVDGGYVVRRWILRSPRTSGVGVYLHSIRGVDPSPAHDHPAHNVSWVLKGVLEEWKKVPGCEEEVLRYREGELMARRAETAHKLWVPEGGEATTLWLRGPRCRHWGFYTPDGWREAGAYRATEGQARVVSRPGQEPKHWTVTLARSVGEEVVVELPAETPEEAERGALAAAEQDDGVWLDAERAGAGTPWITRLVDGDGVRKNVDPAYGGFEERRAKQILANLQARIGQDGEGILEVLTLRAMLGLDR